MSILSIVLYIELYVFVSAVLILKTGARIDNPCFLFWLMYTVFLGLGPVVCALYRYTPSHWCNPYVFVLLPLIFFVGGVYFFYGKKTHSTLKKNSQQQLFCTKPLSRRAVLLVFYAIGVAAGIAYIVKTGLYIFSDNFNDVRISNQSGMGPFLYLNGMLVLVLPMLFELVQQKRFSKKIFIVLFVIAIGTFLLRGSRGLCAIPIIIVIIQFALKRQIKPICLLGLLLLGILGLAFLSLLRGSLGEDANIGAYLINFFGVSFENLARIIRATPETLQYQYGSTFFINLAILMPGPNIDFTLWLKESLHLQYSGGGLTPTLVGDLYLNFGYCGIAIGMVIIGILISKLNEMMQRFDSNQVYYIYLSLTICLCITGGISGASLTLLMNSIAYVAIVLLSSCSTYSKINHQGDG